MMEIYSAVQYFEARGGGRVFQIPIEAFPGFWTHVYLVLVEDYRALIDTGSGFGNANDCLEAGFRAASEILGERSINLSDLTHILITHGHIDHFGGLSYVRPRTQALLGVHELDRRNLTNYEERLVVVSRFLERFLLEAGVSEEGIQNLTELYKITKALFHSVPVDFTFEAIGMRLGPFEFLHVPGHCAGHVVIRLHDILFSGDHVLDDISPHQAPEHLTLSTGLEHYLRSLDLLVPWANHVHLTLGGHKNPIYDLPKRVKEIRETHTDRLRKVLEILEEPHTVADVSHTLFGEVHGYNALLALEETGAHIEYLYQHGMLGIENLVELESDHRLRAVLYKRLENAMREA